MPDDYAPLALPSRELIVQFTLHTDPIELSCQIAPALQEELVARLAGLQPRVKLSHDAKYITIELDGELVGPAPGELGTDEMIIDGAEAVLPEDTAFLIWFLLGEDRSTLLYWRFNPNDPFLKGGPVYDAPY
jgi:hypothetical protein